MDDTLERSAVSAVVSHEVETVRDIAMHMPHRQHVPPELRHDHRAECLLGAMQLNGHITKEQYQAGVRLRGTAARWLGMWLEEEEHELEVEQSISRAYREAHTSVLRVCGARGVRAVWRTCVFNDPIASDELPLLRRGLNVL